MNPINYQALMAQLDLSPILQGLQARQQRKAQESEDAFRADQMDIEQRRQAIRDNDATRKAGFVEAFGLVSANPTQAGWRMLRGRYPDFVDQVDSGEKAYSAAGNSVMTTAASNVLAGIDSGRPELATTAIDEVFPLIEGSGISSAGLQTVRSLLASGKPEQVKAARGIATMILAQHSGDRFDQVYNSLSREEREREIQPDRVRAAEADADWKETRSRYAPVQQEATLAGKNLRNSNTRSIIANRGRPKPPRAARVPRPGKEVTATGPNGQRVKLVDGKWMPM